MLRSSYAKTSKWHSTPDQPNSPKRNWFSANIIEKIAEKRRLRKRWQITRAPNDKLILNHATKEIKKILQEEKNKSVQDYLEGLSPTEATDYSLWKATKKLKQPQQYIAPIKDSTNKWARNDKEKAYMFANHLADIFKPFAQTISNIDETEIINLLEVPFQMTPPMKVFTTGEIKSVIRNDMVEKNHLVLT